MVFDPNHGLTNPLKKMQVSRPSLKTSMQKSRQISIYPRGLVHAFRQKFDISSTFVFRQNRPRKAV